MRVFAIGFLGAAPRRMTQEVDAHAAEIVAPERADFAADRIADALFQLRIPGRSARHGDRKGRPSVQNDAAGPIGEADAGNVETRDFAGDPKLAAITSRGRHRGEPRPQRQLAVHEADFLVEAERVAQSPGALFNLVRSAALRSFEGRRRPRRSVWRSWVRSPWSAFAEASQRAAQSRPRSRIVCISGTPNSAATWPSEL